MSRTVYVNVYFGKFPESGFEIGHVYDSEVEANRNAHDDARQTWDIHRVEKRILHI